MNSLSDNFNNEKTLLASISGFCKEYSAAKALKKANAYKSKGTPVLQIFTYFLQLVYTKKSMYMNLLNGTHKAGFAKDAVYRLLNSPLLAVIKNTFPDIRFIEKASRKIEIPAFSLCEALQQRQ